MSEIEKVKARLDQLKKKYDNYFKLFLLFLTGTGLTSYNVILGDKPIYVLIISIGLAITSIWILSEMKKINEKIDDDIDKLGEL